MSRYKSFPRCIDLQDGEVFLLPSVLPDGIVEQFVDYLRDGVDWNHEVYRGTATRRGTAWFADEGVEYRYSGQSMIASGWDDDVQTVRAIVEEKCGVNFNSALLNHYPDGRAQMGWHSDDEPELGQNPTIASLSIGVPRVFKLRHKETRETHQFILENNSLLVMAGELQHNWQHTLPRRTEKVGERFNLTFRCTIPDYWKARSA